MAPGSVVPEAQLLAALEDGLGAQDPGAERPTRVSAVTVQENVSHGNHSVARGTALPGPVEHALRRSFWSTRSGALAAAVGFVAATWLAARRPGHGGTPGIPRENRLVLGGSQLIFTYFHHFSRFLMPFSSFFTVLDLSRHPLR